MESEKHRDEFYKALDDIDYALGDDFNSFGTKEWADMTYNIREKNAKCPNGCLYCYVNVVDRRFASMGVGSGGGKNEDDGEINSVDDIEEVPKYLAVNPKRITKGWRKTKIPKRIMFPSTHDIFPDVVDGYITQAKKMIEAGHQVLCVSKPNFKSIRKICKELDDEIYRRHFIFRFTIGAASDKVLKVWEPFAPSFEERMRCLRYVHRKGFKVGVSMEPVLENPIVAVKLFDEYVNDEIWIGMMNHRDQIFQGRAEEEVPSEKELRRLEDLYEYDSLLKIVQKLRNNKNVFWKEGIVKLLLFG